MPKDPWTDSDPKPGDFDPSVGKMEKSHLQSHPGRPGAKLTVVDEADARLKGAEETGGSIGFWSYVRSDDENSGGRIGTLAEHIRREFTLITGENLRLFVDRDLAWGEEWKRRIDEELQAVTFLIPVITPAYFKSQACRDELLTFAGHANSLGLDELVLPIYYVDVPALEEYVEGADQVVDLVYRRQHEDWRDLRLRAEDDPGYLKAVAGVARRLEEIASRAEMPPAQLSSDGAGDVHDEELGYLDLLAQGEEALPRWNQTLEEFGAQMRLLAKQSEVGGENMSKADARGAGFAGRLSVARSLAKTLDPTATRMNDLALAYTEDLVRVDPMVLTLVRLAKEDEETRDDAGTTAFFEAVSQMVVASREAGSQLQGLLKAIEVPSKFSRDLRVPLDKIRTALRSILDGQAVMDEWERQIESLDSSDSSHPVG
jgi:hypothetical protein